MYKLLLQPKENNVQPKRLSLCVTYTPPRAESTDAQMGETTPGKIENEESYKSVLYRDQK